MLQIDSDIPLPPGRPRVPVIPWRALRVGESVFVSDANTALRSAGWPASLVGSANRRNPGLRFVVRRVDGGVRFWRVA